jgi:GTP-binding protein HflX
MSYETAPQVPRAALVGVQLPHMTAEDLASSMAEMGRLVHTLGFKVVATVTQKRPSTNSPAVLGDGKLRELAALTGGTGVIPSGALQRPSKAAQKRMDAEGDPDAEEGPPPPVLLPEERPELVVVDVEMTPSQLSNMEKLTGVEVLDRSGVIIQIFNRHAHTRQARLEVEIARLLYEAPRQREKASTVGRQRAGGTGGKGNTEVELDKRKIRDRVAELRAELATLQVSEETRRSRRREQQKVALVGYTNAGKSSLMRALTGSEVLVADKLFATLGTTVRALHPESTPRILISDTVGFIRNLPHDLVASFRSTLDEAHDASLLLLVVDASDPAFRAQLEVTTETLKDIGALTLPRRLVLNKVDRLDDAQRAALRKEYPDAIMLSAHDAADITRLRTTLVDFFESDMEDITLKVPYARAGVVGDIRAQARVLGEEYTDDATVYRVRATAAAAARLKALLR